jgi:cob(I)alamin adenosyltransferase
MNNVIDSLIQIQNDLFIVGADLADPGHPSRSENHNAKVTEQMYKNLEQIIDKFEAQLDPISFFILPGGSIQASIIHNSRAIARRAEIAVVNLSTKQKINNAIIIYLNRLSDLLFVMARYINKTQGVADVAWRKGTL